MPPSTIRARPRYQPPVPPRCLRIRMHHRGVKARPSRQIQSGYCVQLANTSHSRRRISARQRAWPQAKKAPATQPKSPAAFRAKTNPVPLQRGNRQWGSQLSTDQKCATSRQRMVKAAKAAGVSARPYAQGASPNPRTLRWRSPWPRHCAARPKKWPTTRGRSSLSASITPCHNVGLHRQASRERG